jgi:intracellular septation protein A
MNPLVEITALLCGLLVVSWVWRPRQIPEMGVLLLLIAYALMGGWALWFGVYSSPDQEEPAGFEYWKPTVLYWTLAVILIIAPLMRWGYPAKAILGTYFALTSREWRLVNNFFAMLYTLLGSMNLFLAFNAGRDGWVGFKYSCMMNLIFIILFRLNFVWLPILKDVTLYLYGRARTVYQYFTGLK